MVESPEELLNYLCDELLQRLSADPDAIADPHMQHGVETAVAEALAILQGLEASPITTQRSPRQILARDLWLSADLVLRSLRSMDRE